MPKAAKTRSTASSIRLQIERGGEKLWRHNDFRDQPFPAVAQTLSRLTRNGTLERLSKGVYYRPRSTAFGPSRPSPTAIQKLAERTKTIFPSGTAAANLLGFSTQTPRRSELATSSLSLPRRLIGVETRVQARRPEAWKSLSETEARESSSKIRKVQRTTGTEYLPACPATFAGCFFVTTFALEVTSDSIASLFYRFNGKTTIPAVNLRNDCTLSIAIDCLDAKRGELRRLIGRRAVDYVGAEGDDIREVPRLEQTSILQGISSRRLAGDLMYRFGKR